MPLYEYRCPACAARFEVLQRVGEDASALACPDCGAAGVERQLSTFAAATGGRESAGEPFGCGRPACAGGTCAGGDADWN
jgi:putative FmdB family regulatory protein